MAKAPVRLSSAADVDQLDARVRASADQFQQWLRSHSGDGLDLLRALKFESVGFHPTETRALNAIEQVNQTWTYLVALAAVRQLMQLHPDVGGFTIAPGAHASQPLDVMSSVPGVVGAETFAAVDPRNNGKLAADLAKLASRAEPHRYVFFASPLHPGTHRLPQFDRSGVQVWSVET